MLKIKYSNKFSKDFKLIKKRNYDINKLKETINLLVLDKPLPRKYKEHQLIGKYKRI